MESTCPASLSCQWIGKISDLLKHFEINHTDLIVPYPYTNLPNIKKDNQSCNIFKQNGLIFLLQTKCHVIQARIWHCVKVIGDNKMENLEFVVEYKNGSNSIVKRKRVEEENRMLTLHKQDCIEVHTSSLFRELGDYNKIKFAIRIEPKKEVGEQNLEPLEWIKCLICQKTITKNSRTLCRNCCVNTFCKFRIDGCKYYTDNHFELNKHEEWYCEYSSRFCENCNRNIAKESFFNHHKNCNFKLFLVDSHIMSHSKLRVDEFYSAILKSYRTTFKCDWRVGKFGNIYMTIVADDSHTPFCCELKFLTIYDSEIVIKLSNNKDNSWSTNLTANNSDLEDVISKNKYNMSLVINRRKCRII